MRRPIEAGGGAPEAPRPGPRATRRRRSGWLRGLLAVALILAALEYGVLPALVAAHHDVDAVRTAALELVALGFVLEVASLLCFTGLSRSVLPSGERLGWGTQLAIDVTGYGVSHVVPGGGATAMGVRYELMTSAGVPGASVVTATATQTVLSDLALAACYLAGAAVAAPLVVQHSELVAAGLLGVAVLAAAAVAVPVVRRRGWAWTRTARTRAGAWLGPRMDRAASQLLAFVQDRSRTAPAVAFALGKWLLDAACLYVCLASFSDTLPQPEVVLTAYGFANLLGLLPLTPGGLGIVEGTLIPLLIALGTTASGAVVGVLAWRVLQFWLPVPVSAGTYLWLRLTGRITPRSRRPNVTGS